jgi:hypothetical protein
MEIDPEPLHMNVLRILTLMPTSGSESLPTTTSTEAVKSFPVVSPASMDPSSALADSSSNALALSAFALFSIKCETWFCTASISSASLSNGRSTTVFWGGVTGRPVVDAFSLPGEFSFKKKEQKVSAFLLFSI